MTLYEAYDMYANLSADEGYKVALIIFTEQSKQP